MDLYLNLCQSYFMTKNCLVSLGLTYNNGQDEINLLAVSFLDATIYDCTIQVYRDKRLSEAKLNVLIRKMTDVRRELKIKALVGDKYAEFRRVQYVITNLVAEEKWLTKFKEHGLNLLAFTKIIDELKLMNLTKLGYNNKMINLLQLG